MKNIFKKKGFTMIEMMVAFLLISILIAFVFVQMNGATNTGKDAQRKADINLLAGAVASYSADHYGSKPISVTACTIGGGTNQCSTSITQSLQTYLTTLPTDPTSGVYYIYQSDGSSCTISTTLSSGSTYVYSCN
jgi:prepilin-type N-terminal cleavage/methylation domain-containing protein